MKRELATLKGALALGLLCACLSPLGTARPQGERLASKLPDWPIPIPIERSV